MVLVADGRHLLTDVWTSAGVLVGIALVAIFGWQPLDPIVALLVGVNILRIGYDLVRRSLSGLLDAALPAEDIARIEAVLDRYRNAEVRIDVARTREAGRQRFAYLNLTVPGDWPVTRSHVLADDLEGDIDEKGPRAARKYGVHSHGTRLRIATQKLLRGYPSGAALSSSRASAEGGPSSSIGHRVRRTCRRTFNPMH